MLPTIWFVLWGVLWAVYFMLDGFDLGLGILRPFLAKNEQERRITLNAVGPFWDGNEVWLITAGGVTFAAFPGTYAVMFSALYTPLMLLLFALILRGISFEFRGKEDAMWWRKLWDGCQFVGSFVPALLLGVAFANIFAGIPIDKDGVFQGNLFTLLNPYGLLGGVYFVLLFCVHGAVWLTTKSQGALQERAGRLAAKLWAVLLIVAIAFLSYTWFRTTLWQNVMAKPVLLILPLLYVIGLLGTRVFIARKAWWKAWFSSSVTIVGCTLFAVAGLYPALLPSSLDPAFSRTAFNTQSSPLTLAIMLGVALVMVPIVIIYQAWVYHRFSGPIPIDALLEDESY
ncbi:MAG TPA: cytochrome d ubiquinol oxidase subunit II [Acidobacteriota bacterium]|nr:cytochrome d ubiquinol oxidase subunit II [Acidobacteriota bacterium]